MGAKVKYRNGAWWVFVNHHGRRKAKKVGDRETAQRVAQAVRERIARRGLALPTASGEQSLRSFAGSWLVVYNQERPHDSLGRVPPLTFLPRLNPPVQSPFAVST